MVHRADSTRAPAGGIRIASLDDPRVADYRLVANPPALARAGLFVAEGRWVVERLLAKPHYRTRSVLLTPTALTALTRALPSLASGDVPLYVVEQSVMSRLAGFNIHRGCLAVADRPAANALNANAIARAQRVLVLEGVSNPDNVGGIFRSAAAFAVDAIVLGPACGDPLYRKAIRTSMAATLEVPYMIAADWPGAIEALRASGLSVLALTPHGDATLLHRVPPPDRVALLLGSESTGLTAAARGCADLCVRIASTDRLDSLNVAVAASIALHHFFAAHTSSR